MNTASKAAAHPNGRTAAVCDLCGASDFEPILESPRLDGPLVRCRECGLHAVSHRSSSLTFGSGSAEETSHRIVDANQDFVDLDRREEIRLNTLNSNWRLDLISKQVSGGRLLEVGCGRGDFIRVAAERFEVWGIEPNPALARDAAQRNTVFEGLVDDAPDDQEWTQFDVVVAFHVLEHVESPTRFVRSLARRLKPGGLLVLETPDIDSAPYRWFGPRWRQFIPEHYYFFDTRTLTRLIRESDCRVIRVRRIGKYASPALVLNRLGRQIRFLRAASGWHLPGRVRVNPGDILLAMAVRDSGRD
jgi:2-polyprenyl-3-methyl-5-hydroxy-6-metoxy-1,4-benzoquinol methylase